MYALLERAVALVTPTGAKYLVYSYFFIVVCLYTYTIHFVTVSLQRVSWYLAVWWLNYHRPGIHRRRRKEGIIRRSGW